LLGNIKLSQKFTDGSKLGSNKIRDIGNPVYVLAVQIIQQ